MNTGREESIIFNELAELCSSPGYAHVMAFFCFRDNTASISDQVTPETILEQHKPESLIRTEISTLVGLLVKNEINLTLPSQDAIQSMINQTETLLSELQHSLSQPMRSHLENVTSQQDTNSFSVGTALREPIYYGGESAYDFQYLDFACQKYAADNEWLKANKGFLIEEAAETIRKIIEIHQLKMLDHLKSLREVHPDSWTMLPSFIFTLDELTSQLNMDSQVIRNILSSFRLPSDNKNEAFIVLNDFNVTNACPLLPLGNDRYLLFQHYSLAESLYESPFYWMYADKSYRNKTSETRGQFVEKFCAEKLIKVFGPERVFSNIDIYNPQRP